MLVSKVYSHALLSFIHGVLQNIDALFSDTCSVQVLVAFPGEIETPGLCRLASQLGGKHPQEGSPYLSSCMYLALFTRQMLWNTGCQVTDT